MSQQNVGLDMYTPQAADRSYGRLVQGQNVPYVSVAQAIAAINISFRYRGKTLLIDDGTSTGAVEYWWRVGTGDGQLVPKISREQVLEFIIGDGGANTPADGSAIYPGGTNPGTLVNCKILGVGGDVGLLSSILRSGGLQYYQYDPVAGTIALFNVKFTVGSWWFVKYQQL